MSRAERAGPEPERQPVEVMAKKPDRRKKPEKRQPKQSREDLRRLLVQTGRTLLIEEGLGIGTGTLTFKRVFERVEADTGLRLSNASVIRRVWENLADYQADVLATIAAEDGLGEFDRTIRALAPVVAELDLSTPEARDRSLREVFRHGGAANIFALLESPNWSLWIGVWAMAMADTLEGGGQSLDHQGRIRASLLEGYEGFTRLWEDAYTRLAAILGVRIRQPLTMRQFTVAIGALAEGCSLRQRLDPQMEGILRPTGPGGEVQEWTLFGIGLDALQQLFFEPDPEWSSPPG
jgi:hypothetical protein